jgi:hypothetical protein
MLDNFGILEEVNEGQDYRFYVYDFENEEVISWFNTEAEAENYLDGVKKIMGVIS